MINWLLYNTIGIRSWLVLRISTGVLQIFASLAFVWASKRVIDIATGIQDGELGNGIFLMVIAIAFEIGAGNLGSRMEKLLTLNFQNKLRFRLFRHLLVVKWVGRDVFHSGDTMNRLERDVKDVGDFVSMSLPSLIITTVQFCASFFYLFRLNHHLACVMVGIVPFFLLISKLYVKKMKRLTHEVRSTEGNVQSFIQENLQNKLVVKTLGMEFIQTGRLLDIQALLRKQVVRQTNYSLYSRVLISAGFACGYLTAFVWGATGLYSGTITYGMMTAFLQLVAQVQRPIVQLASLVPICISASTAVERLRDLENQEEEPIESKVEIENPVGIRLQDISFAYTSEGRKVIKEFSFDFHPGSRTAILGETGAGKTTLIRLLLGLIIPDSGNIYLYDKIGKVVSVSSATRTNFVYVPQGNTLLSGTIRDNLLLGNPDADDEQLKEVLHIAVADFVFGLPGGLDTLCGEKGSTLSEGQAQRIAIARSLLSKGSVYLLDEVTSALDNVTEQILLERFNAYSRGKTLLFITHRQEVLAYCDQILTMNKEY